MLEKMELDAIESSETPELTDEQVVQVWANVAQKHPALQRVHEQLNDGVGAAITSYDRMHHRHSR